MATQLQTESKAFSGRAFTPVPSGLLQRKCAACGNHTVAGGECAECDKKKQTLQRASLSPCERGIGDEREVPPIVHDVLRSPGQPLDLAMRAFFEPRFGHDFSQVRVHTDAKASASAEAVNALAYTVGSNIVFRTGRPEPDTAAGRYLLAHELAHTVQQSGNSHAAPAAFSIGATHDPAEAEADAVAALVSGESADNGNVAGDLSSVAPTLAKVDCTTLTYKTCKPYSCGYGGSGVCGWGGIKNGCRCMGATRPSPQRVLEVLLIIGISITLLATIILALIDPEPVTKLGLAGLSAAQIALLLTMLGYEDSGERASEGTASLGGDASAVNPQNVA
jgi:hypothetical protein